MSIILAKKKKNWKHFRADFEKFQEMCETWMIENSHTVVERFLWSKIPIDHKNALVFYQTVSGKSSWSFSYRWIRTQYQLDKISH